MDPREILVILALVSVVWGGVSVGRIGKELQRRGIAVNWFLGKILMIRWVSQYKEITTAEQGRPGNLFWHFVIAMNLALFLAILALVVDR